MTEIAFDTAAHTGAPVTHAANKPLLAIYGLSSYLIGCSGLVALILTMAGILPFYRWLPLADNPAGAILVNVLLTGLFGLQHSVMARPFFKRAFHRWFGPAGERSTFVLASGLTLIVVLGLWQPVPGVVWVVDSMPWLTVTWAVFIAGWCYLFAATFAINHFDLFGLRQIWFALLNRPYEAPLFKERWMYRYSRHPIMLGMLVGMWVVPEMTASRMVLTLTITAYVFIGVMYEERDLLAAFGARYARYRQRVGMFFTLRSVG